MNARARAKFLLELGQSYPYDAPDEWQDRESDDPSDPPVASDWAHAAARGVISDLKDRRGIKNGFENVDKEVREGIVESLAEIIRVAYEEMGPK